MKFLIYTFIVQPHPNTLSEGGIQSVATCEEQAMKWCYFTESAVQLLVYTLKAQSAYLALRVNE